MDDHSRFIVSHALAHHQRSELVMEALARGIATYGTPEEILTDQGRQYTAWRGETDFERELRRNGIRHVKSRPQHPQTLGKVERFWKTLWDEFPQTITMPKEETHEPIATHPRIHQGRAPEEPQASRASDAALAPQAGGPGRDRPPSLSDGAQRLEWGPGRDGGDCRGADL